MDQPTTEILSQWLDQCCRLVAEKYHKPDISVWTNRDYVFFANSLFKQTGVQLSPTTVKRIFGKLKTAERYYPQRATRNALARYAGFDDWDSFLKEYKMPEPTPAYEAEYTNVKTPDNLEAPSITITNPSVKKKKAGRTALLAACLALSIGVWYLTKNYTSSQKFRPGTATLICNKPKGYTPHTVTFKLKLAPDFRGDVNGFTISFDDIHSDRKIAPDATISQYYETPGRYYATLKYKGRACDTVPVYLQSDGWVATAVNQFDTSRVYPVKLNKKTKDGILEVTSADVYAAGVDTTHTFFVEFANSTPMKISGDNYELTTSLTTSMPRPGVRCSEVNIIVYGERSKQYVTFIKPGCVNWTLLQFSEVIKSGQKEDLSFLGVDLTNGGTIKLRVVDRTASLIINDKVIHKEHYNYPLGKIYAVKIVFAGIGQIRYLTIKDMNTGYIFSEGADEKNY